MRTAAAAVALLGATACAADPEPAPVPPKVTGPVFVPVPAIDPALRAECAALIGALPAEVDPGVRRRRLSGDDELTAAWGEPPVILECGVEPPERLGEPVVVNGVLWSVRDIGPGFRWTTRDLAVTVAVEVPDAYENGAEIVNPLSGPLKATLAP